MSWIVSARRHRVLEGQYADLRRRLAMAQQEARDAHLRADAAEAREPVCTHPDVEMVRRSAGAQAAWLREKAHGLMAARRRDFDRAEGAEKALAELKSTLRSALDAAEGVVSLTPQDSDRLRELTQETSAS